VRANDAFWANERPSKESFIRQTSIASPLTATGTTKLSPDVVGMATPPPQQQQPADGRSSTEFSYGFFSDLFTLAGFC